MDRRRGPSTRPASSEEIGTWTEASKSLRQMSNIYANPATLETIARVNRLILAWPKDDTLPAQGIDGVKTIYKKLAPSLLDIKHTAEQEAKAIDDAIEGLGVLIALRKAPEPLPLEKRNKRARGHSPASSSSNTATPTPSSGRVSITIPLRNSLGPTPASFSREPKARREALASQLPLKEGRKVAFHPPTKPGEPDENTWILAVVIKCLQGDKNRYEVQDAESQDDGQPGMKYNTTLRSIIPLPDPTAPPENPAHPSAYPEFPVGSTVMALYPDTSCFYRGEVMEAPHQPIGKATGFTPTYTVKFEEDGDLQQIVAAQWVVERPDV